MNRTLRAALVVSAVTLTAPSAYALSLDELQVHGFLSQGYMRTTANNYLANTEDGTFELFEAGINFTADLTDDLRTGVQLFTMDLGRMGDYKMSLDWAQIDYRYADWAGIRLGKFKVPLGLYWDTSDVDAARTPALLPQSIYDVTIREFFLSTTGGNVYGNIALGAGGALEYSLFGGTVFFPNSLHGDSQTKYIAGGRLLWETPLHGLKLSASALSFQISFTDYLDPVEVQLMKDYGMLDPSFNEDRLVVTLKDTLYAVGSLEYALGDFLLAVEYLYWRGSFESSLPGWGDTGDFASDGAYAMVNYRILPWLQAGTYLSAYFADLHDRKGERPRWPVSHAAYQYDGALTLRFDINDYWLVKLEGHAMNGTAALVGTADANVDLNPDPSKTKKNWFMGIVKTSLTF